MGLDDRRGYIGFVNLEVTRGGLVLCTRVEHYGPSIGFLEVERNGRLGSFASENTSWHGNTNVGVESVNGIYINICVLLERMAFETWRIVIVHCELICESLHEEV